MYEYDLQVHGTWMMIHTDAVLVLAIGTEESALCLEKKGQRH